MTIYFSWQEKSTEFLLDNHKATASSKASRQNWDRLSKMFS